MLISRTPPNAGDGAAGRDDRSAVRTRVRAKKDAEAMMRVGSAFGAGRRPTNKVEAKASSNAVTLVANLLTSYVGALHRGKVQILLASRELSRSGHPAK